MAPWIGLALALRQPDGEAMRSSVASYLHPIAGRPLCWHAVAGLAAAEPAPARLLLLGSAELPVEAFADLPVPLELVPAGPAAATTALADALALVGEGTGVLLADAAVPLLRSSVQPLLGAAAPAVVADARGCTLAIWLPGGVRPAPGAADLDALAAALPAAVRHPAAADARLVRDRADLAAATTLIRDQVVRRVMEGGVTVLLPETVLMDVEVRVGRDSVLYPGVVLEGQTNIGEETVIGPGCRIIDSWIGRGVELKGWNYISRTSVRNRAILEPYVRRGYD